MASSDSSGRRTLSVRRHIIGPPAPRPITVERRRLKDYPGVSRAHREIASKLSSPLMLGPPICNELMDFVQHAFTDEEARVVQHLHFAVARTAREVARADRRPKDVDAVAAVLKRIAFEKHAISAEGRGERRKYRLLPVAPGMFEMILVGQNPETLTPWHRRFAELFEALFETGYLAYYGPARTPVTRFLPVSQVAEAQPLALPSDQWEAIVDRYDTFSVGYCQCRTSMKVTDRDCGKPVRNCTALGDFAKGAIKGGQMEAITKQEFLDIKREAETHGLVSWIFNTESSKGQLSCSCCGCCCHFLRSIREFNVPAAAAPPHFMPEFDRQACDYCGKCARVCPTGSLAVDRKGKQAWQLKERCVGCGLCVVACDKQHAVRMEPVPDYQLPANSWFAMLTRSLKPAATNAAWAWLKR